MYQRNPLLVGLAGKPGSGKTTLAESLVIHLDFVHLAFAEPLKAGLNAMFNWTMQHWDDREWKETAIPGLNKSPRQLAQTLGTEWGRNLVNDNLWVWLMEHHPKFVFPRVVISDVRFQNEVEFIKKQKGILVYIDRDSNLLTAVPSHSSEAFDVKAHADAVIYNNLSKLDLLMNMRLILEDRPNAE